MKRNVHHYELVVEGVRDLAFVCGLMGRHVTWPCDIAGAPVHITIAHGASNLLKDGMLTGILKAARLQTLGVVLDADDDVAARYQAFRNRCVSLFPSLPMQMPEGGLIVTNEAGRTLGLWIMPDNRSVGGLEHLLAQMVPATAASLWAHARDSTERSKQIGAPWREVHRAKADIYTYLAWQDEPGIAAGYAIPKRYLDHEAPAAAPFVSWVRQLFSI